MVALKIATILERTGDYARNIANRTRVIAEIGNENIPGVNIGRMGQVTQEMLRDVLRAYKKQDADTALEVWRRDIEVDHMHTAFYKEVLASMARDPNLVATGAHLLFIAKNIEMLLSRQPSTRQGQHSNYCNILTVDGSDKPEAEIGHVVTTAYASAC